MARLNIFGTFADNFISFAGGNPGALNTLFELQKEAKKVIKILELYEREIITQQDIDERIKNVGYGRNFDDLIKESEEIKNE